jgi:alkylation response protein AidB-like acyl-CoA dehydrogenase
MDFEFSSEQEEFSRIAAAVLADRCTPERIRSSIARADPLDRALWAEIVNLGWLTVDLPVTSGGLGAGFVETSILLVEIGRSLAPMPYLPTILALGALHQAGEESLVQEVLSGKRMGAAAMDNELVVGGPDADLVVSADAEHVTLLEDALIHSELRMDLTRTVGWMPERGRRIGDADGAKALLERGAVGTAALLLGGASKALDLSVQYAKDRRQFDRPIGSFQAIKHHCADMLVDIEAMRSLVFWAAWCVDQAHPDAAIAASAAKVWCADAGLRVIEKAVQIHGGIGFTWDHDLHLYLKRAVLDINTFGSARFHKDRLVDLLRYRLDSDVPFS